MLSTFFFDNGNAYCYLTRVNCVRSVTVNQSQPDDDKIKVYNFEETVKPW